MKTIKNLITVGALVIAVFGTHVAHAYVPGIWDPQPRVNTNESAFYVVPQTKDEPVVRETNTTTVVSNQNTSTTNTSTTPAPKKVATTTVRRTTVSSNNTITTPAKELPQDTTMYPVNNGLTALTIQGSGGFMPSSIWQWLFVILLILAIIIVARMLGRPRHQVHTVTAH